MLACDHIDTLSHARVHKLHRAEKHGRAVQMLELQHSQARICGNVVNLDMTNPG